jgi:hypothetical protein
VKRYALKEARTHGGRSISDSPSQRDFAWRAEQPAQRLAAATTASLPLTSASSASSASTPS